MRHHVSPVLDLLDSAAGQNLCAVAITLDRGAVRSAIVQGQWVGGDINATDQANVSIRQRGSVSGLSK